MPRLPIEGMTERRPYRRARIAALVLALGAAGFGVFICTRPRVVPERQEAGWRPTGRRAARLPARPWTKPAAEARPRPLRAAGPVRKSPFSAGIWKKVQRLDPELRKLRRRLHAKPELAGQEVETARLLAKWLEEAGLAVRTGVGGHGVVAELRGVAPGRTVALVAGMDGVAVADRTGQPYASKEFVVDRGRRVWLSHAGGRDVEMTVLLGVARILAGLRQELPGSVRFLFQPAAERPGRANGAHAFVRAGALGEVSALFWLVADPRLRVGRIGFPTGSRWRAATSFRVVVQGGGCRPSGDGRCVDPLLTAAQALVGLQAQLARAAGLAGRVRVSVHGMEARGEPGRVPRRAVFEGLIQYRSTSRYQQAVGILRRAVQGAAVASGARASVSFGQPKYLVTSDEQLVRWLLPTARRVLGTGGIALGAWSRREPGFQVYANQVPSALLLLGTHSSRLGFRRKLYAPTFDVDEECLSVGVHFLANAALDWLRTHPKSRPSTQGP